jgi:phage tail-like protein
VAQGNGSDGNGYQTFQGAGFGTLLVQLSQGPKETPPVVSNRAYLRNGLPAVYQDNDFGMRFVGALEGLLDPIMAILDSLPAHFDPSYAPRDVLELLSHWLGVELDESQPVAARRETLRKAAELSRFRGTARGMQLALDLAFPEVPLRVEDQGKVLTKPGEEIPPRQFIVYCDKAIPEEIQARVARCIEQHKPVDTPYRLRVKAPKKKPQDNA